MTPGFCLSLRLPKISLTGFGDHFGWFDRKFNDHFLSRRFLRKSVDWPGMTLEGYLPSVAFVGFQMEKNPRINGRLLARRSADENNEVITCVLDLGRCGTGTYCFWNEVRWLLRTPTPVPSFNFAVGIFVALWLSLFNIVLNVPEKISENSMAQKNCC